MPSRLLLLVLATFLLCTGLWAQEPAPPQEPKPATQEAQPPAKAPDAFHYFFGKKDKKDAKDGKKEPEAKAAVPVKKAEPAAVKELPSPAPQPAPETPIAAPAPVAPVVEAPAAPASPVPEPQPQPQPEVEKAARPAPRVDAFQYFFGKSAQPAPKLEAKNAEPGEKRPIDAFEYLFGKTGNTVPAEPAKDSAKPPAL